MHYTYIPSKWLEWVEYIINNLWFNPSLQGSKQVIRISHPAMLWLAVVDFLILNYNFHDLLYDFQWNNQEPTKLRSVSDQLIWNGEQYVEWLLVNSPLILKQTYDDDKKQSSLKTLQLLLFADMKQIVCEGYNETIKLLDKRKIGKNEFSNLEESRNILRVSITDILFMCMRCLLEKRKWKIITFFHDFNK